MGQTSGNLKDSCYATLRKKMAGYRKMILIDLNEFERMKVKPVRETASYPYINNCDECDDDGDDDVVGVEGGPPPAGGGGWSSAPGGGRGSAPGGGPPPGGGWGSAPGGGPPPGGGWGNAPGGGWGSAPGGGPPPGGGWGSAPGGGPPPGGGWGSAPGGVPPPGGGWVSAPGGYQAGSPAPPYNGGRPVMINTETNTDRYGRDVETNTQPPRMKNVQTSTERYTQDMESNTVKPRMKSKFASTEWRGQTRGTNTQAAEMVNAYTNTEMPPESMLVDSLPPAPPASATAPPPAPPAPSDHRRRAGGPVRTSMVKKIKKVGVNKPRPVQQSELAQFEWLPTPMPPSAPPPSTPTPTTIDGDRPLSARHFKAIGYTTPSQRSPRSSSRTKWKSDKIAAPEVSGITKTRKNTKTKTPSNPIIASYEPIRHSPLSELPKPPQSTIHQCDICKTQFKTLEKLAKHYKRYHTELKQRNRGTKRQKGESFYRRDKVQRKT